MYVIKNRQTNTYFRGDTPIGPAMGGTIVTAVRFPTKRAAMQQMMTHSFAYVMCEVLPVKAAIAEQAARVREQAKEDGRGKKKKPC